MFKVPLYRHQINFIKVTPTITRGFGSDIYQLSDKWTHYNFRLFHFQSTSTFFSDERNCRILQKLSEDYTDLETRIDEISRQLPSIQDSDKGSRASSSKYTWLLAAVISLVILIYCYYVSRNFKHFANSITHGDNFRPL